MCILKKYCFELLIVTGLWLLISMIIIIVQCVFNCRLSKKLAAKDKSHNREMEKQLIEQNSMTRSKKIERRNEEEEMGEYEEIKPIIHKTEVNNSNHGHMEEVEMGGYEEINPSVNKFNMNNSNMRQNHNKTTFNVYQKDTNKPYTSKQNNLKTDKSMIVKRSLSECPNQNYYRGALKGPNQYQENSNFIANMRKKQFYDWRRIEENPHLTLQMDEDEIAVYDTPRSLSEAAQNRLHYIEMKEVNSTGASELHTSTAQDTCIDDDGDDEPDYCVYVAKCDYQTEEIKAPMERSMSNTQNNTVNESDKQIIDANDDDDEPDYCFYVAKCDVATAENKDDGTINTQYEGYTPYSIRSTATFSWEFKAK